MGTMCRSVFSRTADSKDFEGSPDDLIGNAVPRINPNSRCDADVETIAPYFFHCSLYAAPRNNVILYIPSAKHTFKNSD